MKLSEEKAEITFDFSDVSSEEEAESIYKFTISLLIASDSSLRGEGYLWGAVDNILTIRLSQQRTIIQ